MRGPLLGLLLLGTSLAPPSAPPGSVAATELAALMDGIGPHPVGSPGNRMLADRLARRLSELGLEVDRQRAFVCGDRRGYCGEIENVIGRRAGSMPSGTIVLASHYDSVPASPGAGDSMAGVAAVLEIAGVERGLPPPRNTVVFLLADGEEAGLLGSTAFIRRHVWAAGARAFINLEARGSRGPSFLAETNAPSIGLIRSFARAAAGPSADSGIAALVRMLPNANDLDVYATTGMPGLMFGFVGGFRSYHSASDTVERLSPASLRQHVENARAAVLPLRSEDLRGLDRRRAGFATFFRRAFVWPEGAARPVSVAVMALAAALLAWIVRAGRPGCDAAAGALVSLAAVPLGAAAGVATFAVVRSLSPTRTSWPARLAPGAFAAVAGGVVAALALSWWVGRRRDLRAFWIGGWGAWALIGAFSAFRFLPFAHWFLLPAAVAVVLGPFASRAGRKGEAGAVLLGTCGALVVLWSPLVTILALAGLAALPVLAAASALVSAGAAPLVLRLRRPGRMVLAAGSVWILGLAGASRVPSFTPDQPQFLSLVYALDHDSGRAAWIATGTPLPPALEARASFSGWVAPFGWLVSESGTSAPAPRVDLPAPVLRIDSTAAGDGTWTVTGSISSPRRAPVMHVAFLPGSDATDLRIGGEAVEGLDERNPLFAPGYRVATIWDVPPEGLPIRFRTSGKPGDIVLVDRSFGLPAEGLAIASARPPFASPNQNGDSTLVERRFPIEAPSGR